MNEYISVNWSLLEVCNSQNITGAGNDALVSECVDFEPRLFLNIS